MPLSPNSFEYIVYVCLYQIVLHMARRKLNNDPELKMRINRGIFGSVYNMMQNLSMIYRLIAVSIKSDKYYVNLLEPF